MNNPNLMRPQGSLNNKLVQSALTFTPNGLQYIRQNPHNNQVSQQIAQQSKEPPQKKPQAFFEKKKKSLKPKLKDDQNIPLNNNIIKDDRIQPNNWLRWTSLQQFIQKAASFATKTLESTQSNWKPDLQNIPNLISKVFKRCSSLFNMNFNILPGENSKLELISFDIYGGLLGILYGIINDILSANSQDPKILQYQKRFLSKESQYIFDWNTIRSILEYQIILTKSPTFHLEANYKLCKQALANTNNLLNQQKFMKDLEKLDSDKEEEDQVMDIDEFQIDTSTKKKRQIPQQEHVTRKISKLQEQKYDAFSSDLIRTEIEKQNRILKTNQKIYEETWPHIVQNFQHTQMKDALKREETRMNQMVKWYFAKTQFNEFWDNLNQDQKKQFDVIKEEKLKQDPDPNTHSFLDSNKVTEDLYIDGLRYNKQDIEQHLLPTIRILTRLQAKIRIIKIKNTFKANMIFINPQSRQYFLNKWKKFKTVENYIWKGISRWHLKIPTKPKDLQILPKYKKQRKKEKDREKKNRQFDSTQINYRALPLTYYSQRVLNPQCGLIIIIIIIILVSIKI